MGQKRHIMKHSDYMNLTRRLAFITREADRTRALLTMPVVITTDGSIVATTEPDQDGAVEVHTNQAGIWMAVVQVDTDVANLMDGLVDGFVEVNQARADQGNGATADVRALYEAMAGFLVPTGIPVEGFGPFYPKTRERTRAWMDMVTTWFPDLIDQDQADTIHQVANQPSKRAVVVHPDRAMLSGFFNNEFKATRQGQQSRFDRFYFAISTAGFTATEWGRVAYAIKWNHKIVANKVRFQSFNTWMIEFFQAIGVEPPKDTRQNKYKEPATGRSRTRDFAMEWLR